MEISGFNIVVENQGNFCQKIIVTPPGCSGQFKLIGNVQAPYLHEQDAFRVFAANKKQFTLIDLENTSITPV